MPAPTKTVRIVTGKGPRDAVAAWVGCYCAVTGAGDGGAVLRGRWSITHLATGLAAASCLPISKRDAIALAREWDGRLGSIDPEAADQWEHRREWAAVIHAIRAPWAVPAVVVDDGGHEQETALVLAAEAGMPIDQAGRRVRWRRQWWPAPTDNELQAWTLDSCCETPDGRTVEPDAPDSWLSLLRLV